METIGAALGNDLDFGARRTVEIRRLAGSIYLELLDAVRRSRHHA